MQEINQQPTSWLRRIDIPSPLTGHCLSMHAIPSAAMQLGAWGVGVAFLPGNQKIYRLPHWQLQSVSPDRQTWQLLRRDKDIELTLLIHIWPQQPCLPMAFYTEKRDTLFTLSTEAFYQQAPCYLSMTLLPHPHLTYKAHYGTISARSDACISVYAGAKFETES